MAKRTVAIRTVAVSRPSRYSRFVSRAHHKRKITIPLAVVAGFIPGTMDVIKNSRDNGFFPLTLGYGNSGTNDSNTGMATLLGDFFGIQTAGTQQAYNVKAWSSWRLQYGLYPVLAGFAVHWGANKLGINRMIGRMGIPYVRI